MSEGEVSAAGMRTCLGDLHGEFFSAALGENWPVALAAVVRHLGPRTFLTFSTHADGKHTFRRQEHDMVKGPVVIHHHVPTDMFTMLVGDR